MLDHIGLYVSDFEAAKGFYQAALKPLGYEMIREFPEWTVAGFGKDGKPDFWISQREASHNVHVAFQATDTATVDAFFESAMNGGGSDNGAPGYRTDYAPGYYAAFVIDPFGNNLEAVFNDPARNV